ncbi:hypothetical protein ACFX13_004830 [Malus domestica]
MEKATKRYGFSYELKVELSCNGGLMKYRQSINFAAPTKHQLCSTDKASTTSTLLVRHYPTICQPTIPLSKPQKISLLLLQDDGHIFLKQDSFNNFYYYTYSSNISVEVGLPWKPMVKPEEARFSACLSHTHDNGCTRRDNHSRWAISGFP